jgi:hypothetical protein
MATFFILPPRACLEAALVAVFSRFLPGLPVPTDTWQAVIDILASEGDWPEDLFLIPRDDLPECEAVADALAVGFGAEPGDRVVEVNPGTGQGRSWVLSGVSGPVAAR